MEFIDKFISNPIFIAIAVGIIALLIYFIIKKVLKLIFFALIALGVFLLYVHFTGGDVEKTLEKGKEKANEWIDSAQN
ncbi:MAG: hypothetical protein O3C46_04275 [Bacteroidetes bacterium]|mgnify:CR=1 FL=1|jgi:energy-coupling factor transporter transmembrane protein EcfT|nr:hypothetical protein [Bacteroidota bacterium]MDA0930904.1 hypothetical protein [Bacteroidota bacterium]